MAQAKEGLSVSANAVSSGAAPEEASEESLSDVAVKAHGAKGGGAQFQSAPVHPEPSQVPGKLSVVGGAVPPVSVVPLGSVARDDGVR